MSSEDDAPGEHSQLRIPEFFIVGHHKSGTTALYEMLKRHPQIFMPELKEPRYFAEDLRPLMQAKPGTLPETLEDYLALFADAEPGQRLGEASPSYLRSHLAAGAIAAVRPDARCIAILREPASFVRSFHLQLVQEHVELEKDLRKAIAAEEIERGGRHVRRYSDHLGYVAQLERFRAVFPPEQLLVLIYDDFRRENEATVRQVLRFLDVDDTVAIETVEANPTVAVRSVRMDGAVRRFLAGAGPVSRASKAAIRTLTPQRVHRDGLRSLRRTVTYAPPAPADEEFMIELRRRYKPEVVALSEYLGRDLVALWGYDQLD